MDKLLLVNKPAGISSTQAGSRIKKLIRDAVNVSSIKPPKIKLGHVGTLDLEASGLLLILTGAATRFQSHLLQFEKVYSGHLQLGITTSTDDIHGSLINSTGVNALIDSSKWPDGIERIRAELSGWRMQLAPKISAKKIQGVSSYKRALRGEDVEAREKNVRADILDLAFESPSRIRYELRVSSGFYIRSFAREIGEILGTGGVAESIFRSSIGPFSVREAVHMDELSAEDFQPEKIRVNETSWQKSIPQIAASLSYPTLTLLDTDQISQFVQGNKSLLTKLPLTCGHTLVTDTFNNPLGIVECAQEESRFVFVMPQGS